MKSIILLCIVTAAMTTHGAVVYQHDFGTVAISGKPYTVAPTVLDTHLQSGSQWDTSATSFIGYDGSSGKALSLANSSGTPTFTLTFNVAPGYAFKLDGFSFWRQRSSTGAQNWSLTVNGIAVGSGTVPEAGANTSASFPTPPVSGVEGTVTVVLTLSGASGTGTFRLDDFTLDGVVTDITAPSVAIHAPAGDACSVSHTIDVCTLSGVTQNAVGALTWSNALTAVHGCIPAAASWTIPGMALAVGDNLITVGVTNASGQTAAASVNVARRQPGLAPADVALIGWDDAADAFAFVTLAELPAGTVLFFTDNGWTGSQYRGASPTDGNGSEGLLKFTALTALPAGMIVRSTDTSSALAWTNSGTIPGTSSSFGNLDLAAAGDQIAVFQGPESNPLNTPGSHVFILDDTGAFEPATSPTTGEVPTGLLEGRSAVTLNAAGSTCLVFTNHPGRALRKTEWMAEIANPANWFFGASTALPSGTLTVLPPPLLTTVAMPQGSGSVQGAGRYDAGSVVRLVAVPAPGWQFSRWDDGNAGNVRDLVMPDGGTTATAKFGWKSTVLILR
jgi:hypothetical protein